MVAQQAKITITISVDAKREIMELKESLHVSTNSLYQEAIQEYVKR